LVEKGNKMKVINLFGSPGSGKSTTAAGLFYKMKLDKEQFGTTELVTEFAKRLVWAGREKELTNQLYITAKQAHRLELVRDEVDFAIIDSPLMLGLLYTPVDYIHFETYEPLVLELFNSFENINIFLTRDKPYDPKGRMQTEEQSNELAKKLENMLRYYDIPVVKVPGNADAPDYIMKEILCYYDKGSKS